MNHDGNRTSAASQRTREQLILAAERLFAAEGLNNVSLRQINTAAGQRNSSAAHYHFGSKQSLVEAIEAYRNQRIDDVRRRALAALRAAGRGSDVRGLVDVVVRPLVTGVDDETHSGNYLRFLSQTLGHPQLDLQAMWRQLLTEGLSECYHALRTALPAVPEDLFGARFGLLWELAIHSLADRARIAERSPGTIAHSDPGLYLDNLIDVLAAGLQAPISPETRALLMVRRQRASPPAPGTAGEPATTPTPPAAR